MSRVETISNHATLYLGDCRDILPELTGIDLAVTSPPYDQQRDYGSKIGNWAEMMGDVASGLSASLNPKGQALVNLGLVHRDGRVIRYWDPFVAAMEAREWRLFGWYVWDQLSGMMGDWNGRLAPSHEFIFHFNRAARSVNKTKPTLGGRIHSGNLRQVDGTSKLKSHDGRPVQPTKIPDSVIRTVRETTTGFTAEHPARFPEAFAAELIAPFSNQGETVLDPFMGSGTTGSAAVRMGRQFIGIEAEPKYFDIARRRVEEATRQPDLFIEPAKPPTQEAML